MFDEQSVIFNGLAIFGTGDLDVSWRTRMANHQPEPATNHWSTWITYRKELDLLSSSKMLTYEFTV